MVELAPPLVLDEVPITCCQSRNNESAPAHFGTNEIAAAPQRDQNAELMVVALTLIRPESRRTVGKGDPRD